MQYMEEEQHIHKKRSIVGIIATIFVLLLVGFFTYRVVYFTSLIESGDIDTLNLVFNDSLTINDQLSELTFTEGAADVLSEDDPTIGNPDATFVIVEFADFECPYCLEASNTLRMIAAKYPDKIYYQYRDYPVEELHKNARIAAEAAECANEQGMFWEYHDKIYQNQKSLSDEKFMQLATEVGLDTGQFKSCYQGGRYADEVEEDYQAGLSAGVIGTPTFFINGNSVPGAIPYSVLEALIEQNES
jgi:protein-disulfide isomerase